MGNINITENTYCYPAFYPANVQETRLLYKLLSVYVIRIFGMTGEHGSYFQFVDSYIFLRSCANMFLNQKIS